MHQYIRVMDPYQTEYTLRLERDRVEEIYHEGWKKYVEIHHVQACLLRKVVDDLVVDDPCVYVTLEGMVVTLPKKRFDDLDQADLESILTVGELLELLDNTMYNSHAPAY